jgi:hypothetical protein
VYVENEAMTKRHAYSGLAVLLGVLWAWNFAAAQTEGTARGDQQDQGIDQATPPTDEVERERIPPERRNTPAAEPGSEGGKAFARRQFMQLKKLEEAMKEKLRLSREQRNAIEQLFRDHLALLRERQSRRQVPEADSKDVEEIKALRDKLIKAREAGDEQAVSEARKQLKDKLQERLGSEADPTSEFLDKVAAELDENQRAEFRKLVRRLGIDTPRGPRDLELRKLLRVVRQPEVGLSEQQQRTIRTILRDAAAALADPEVDATKADEITAKARADVFKELALEQQSKVDAALKADEERGQKRPRKRADRLEYPTPSHPEDTGVDHTDTQPDDQQDELAGDEGPNED